MYMMISATVFANYPSATRMSYVKSIMMLLANLKLIFLLPLWRLELLCVSMLVVFWLMLMILSIVFLVVIWALVVMLLKGQGIGINAGRIRAINSRIRGGEVQHTGVIPFLKSLNQQLSVAHKMV